MDTSRSTQTTPSPRLGPPHLFSDAEELVAYAKPYHINIVPEQDTFGHLDEMLQYEQYSIVDPPLLVRYITQISSLTLFPIPPC